jgi:hypothetical protein
VKLRALIAGVLGVGLALLVVACGNSSNGGLLTAAQAGRLNSDFDSVGTSVTSGDCGGASRALVKSRNDVNALAPAGVSQKLINNLLMGLDTISANYQTQCQAATTPTTTTTTPTTTTNTNTTPTTTNTTPTTTTNTTPTTTNTTPTTPTTPAGGNGAGSGGAVAPSGSTSSSGSGGGSGGSPGGAASP